MQTWPGRLQCAAWLPGGSSRSCACSWGVLLKHAECRQCSCEVATCQLELLFSLACGLARAQGSPASKLAVAKEATLAQLCAILGCMLGVAPAASAEHMQDCMVRVRC